MFFTSYTHLRLVFLLSSSHSHFWYNILWKITFPSYLPSSYSLVRQEDGKRAEEIIFHKPSLHDLILQSAFPREEEWVLLLIWQDSCSGRTDAPISVLSSPSLPCRRFRSHDFQVDYSLKSRQADYFWCRDDKICRPDSFNSSVSIISLQCKCIEKTQSSGKQCLLCVVANDAFHSIFYESYTKTFASYSSSKHTGKHALVTEDG